MQVGAQSSASSTANHEELGLCLATIHLRHQQKLHQIKAVIFTLIHTFAIEKKSAGAR